MGNDKWVIACTVCSASIISAKTIHSGVYCKIRLFRVNKVAATCTDVLLSKQIFPMCPRRPRGFWPCWSLVGSNGNPRSCYVKNYEPCSFHMLWASRTKFSYQAGLINSCCLFRIVLTNNNLRTVSSIKETTPELTVLIWIYGMETTNWKFFSGIKETVRFFSFLKIDC